MDEESAASLLRGIAETARAHGNEWDAARLAEMLELYGVYLRGQADASAPPLGFADFVADEALLGRMRAARNATR